MTSGQQVMIVSFASGLSKKAHILRNVLLQHAFPVPARQELDLVLGGLLNEGADDTPQTPEDEGRIQEPKLSQSLRVMLLEHLKDSLQSANIQVLHAQTCSMHVQVRCTASLQVTSCRCRSASQAIKP